MGSAHGQQNHIILHTTFALPHLVNVIKQVESSDLISDANLSSFSVRE